MDRYKKNSAQNRQHKKLIRIVGMGLGAFIVVVLVVSQLIGNTKDEIKVAQQAVDSLFYDAQQIFLAEDISKERLEKAQQEVGRLKWVSRGELSQRLEIAKQKFQYLDMLSTIYDTPQPMIVGNVVSKVKTIKKTVTQDQLTQIGKQLPRKQEDPFNQIVIKLYAQAQETMDNIVDVKQAIAMLPERVDKKGIAETVATVQSIEKKVLPLAQQPLLDETHERFNRFAKQVSDILLEMGAENLDATLISQVLDCQCLSTHLTGTPFDSRPVIALTFDDGPHPEITPQVLAMLEKHQVKGTFFVIGASVDTYPELAKQIVDEGHQIANHTYSHPDLAKLSDSEVLREIQQTQDAIFNATGATPELYRLPYGSGGARVVRLLKPLTSIIWNVDSEDWQSKDKELIVEQVLMHLQPQSLLLMHDTHHATAPALDELIPLLKERGYRFVFPQEVDFDYHYYY